MISRIGIVDDHPALLLGATAMFDAEPDLRVVATASTVAELLGRQSRLDVVLLDLVLGDGSTPAYNVRLLESRGASVIAYTTGDRPRLIREAGRAGAIGMVRKSEPPERVVEAVRWAVRGEVVASSDWAAALDADSDFVSADLSQREAEVLALYASGETAEDVARLLYISRETVLDHIRRVRRKYREADRPAPTKVDLYRRAVEDGLVVPGE